MKATQATIISIASVFKTRANMNMRAIIVHAHALEPASVQAENDTDQLDQTNDTVGWQTYQDSQNGFMIRDGL